MNIQTCFILMTVTPLIGAFLGVYLTQFRYKKLKKRMDTLANTELGRHNYLFNRVRLLESRITPLENEVYQVNKYPERKLKEWFGKSFDFAKGVIYAKDVLQEDMKDKKYLFYQHGQTDNPLCANITGRIVFSLNDGREMSAEAAFIADLMLRHVNKLKKKADKQSK